MSIEDALMRAAKRALDRKTQNIANELLAQIKNEGVVEGIDFSKVNVVVKEKDDMHKEIEIDDSNLTDWQQKMLRNIYIDNAMKKRRG